MKKIFIPLLCLFILFSSRCSFAQENNKVGISLLQPSSEDVLGASTLTNSTNGDWGYVTLVVQENDRDVRKWQDLFEQLREKHLIPIIRIATSPQGEVWRRPEEKDVKDWVDFFDKLNWVVEKRYIVLFNEPNHASEWGGEVDPSQYGKVAVAFAQAFRKANKDYVVMLAGLDAAAPQMPTQLWDNGEFLKEMCKDKDQCVELFKNIDAWASHSYPNPGFSGSVWDTGKKSIRGYEYELDLLKQLGIEKNLPVFITETGWTIGNVSEATVAENYRIAFSEVWGPDDRVQAVTPFVFKYLSQPFLEFSWKTDGGYSAQYNVVKDLEKQKGTPLQIQKGSLEISVPKMLLAQSTYHFSLHIQNKGQAIWSQNDGYVLSLDNIGDEGLQALLSDVKTTKPFEEEWLPVTIKTPTKPQTIQLSFLLNKNGETILTTKKQSIQIEPLPELILKTSLFPRLTANADNFEVQLFNTNEGLVFAKKGLSMRNGVIHLNTISDIIPNENYRVVLVGYPYLPRQAIITFHKGINTISLKKLLPFDADNNGRFDFNDIKTAFANPSFFTRFIPWNRQ